MKKNDTPFKYLSANLFFTKYTSIINFRHKMRGYNGRGAPLTFTEEEKKEILEGLKKLMQELNEYLRP